MKRTITATIFVALATLAGWGVYKITDSQKAGYIVSCVGAAASLAAVFVLPKQEQGLVSTMRIGSAQDTTARGIIYSGKDPIPSVQSDMNIDTVKGGSVIGVELKQTDDKVNN